MKPSILVLVLFLKTIEVFAGGFSTFSHSTPGNNTIYYDDATCAGCNQGLRIFCGVEPYEQYPAKVTHLIEWYYMPNYIIGKFSKEPITDGVEMIESYFIFSETDCTVETFDDKSVWEKALIERKLKPVFIKKVRNFENEIDKYNMLAPFGYQLLLGLTMLLIFLISFVHLFVFMLSGFKIWNKNVKLRLILCNLYLLYSWYNANELSF